MLTPVKFRCLRRDRRQSIASPRPRFPKFLPLKPPHLEMEIGDGRWEQISTAYPHPTAPRGFADSPSTFPAHLSERRLSCWDTLKRSRQDRQASAARATKSFAQSRHVASDSVHPPAVLLPSMPWRARDARPVDSGGLPLASAFQQLRPTRGAQSPLGPARSPGTL